jgi:hypothetical protein
VRRFDDDPQTAPGRRSFTVALVAVAALVVGYAGQGSWGIGVQADPPAVTAVLTDVEGGAGARSPVRLQVSMAVTNSGAQSVTVLAPVRPGSGVTVLARSPAALELGPGRVGRILADVSVRCAAPAPPQLPDLQFELADGLRLDLPVDGSQLLLQGCSRAAPPVRPIAATVVKTAGDDDRLTLALTSPTGRSVAVAAIRAGGVVLAPAPAAPVVTGSRSTTVRLSPPAGCPSEWSVSGTPSALSIDLDPEPGRPGATGPPGSDELVPVALRLGPVLTSWLLRTSCPPARGRS